MWGLDSDEKVLFSRCIGKMVQNYISLSGRPFTKKIDVNVRKDSVKLLNTPIEVHCWKDIWSLTQSIISIYRTRICTSKFRPDTGDGYMWNMDPRTPGFRNQMCNWLIYNLRMVPEQMNIDGKTTTLVHQFSQVVEIMNKYENSI